MGIQCCQLYHLLLHSLPFLCPGEQRLLTGLPFAHAFLLKNPTHCAISSQFVQKSSSRTPACLSHSPYIDLLVLESLLQVVVDVFVVDFGQQCHITDSCRLFLDALLEEVSLLRRVGLFRLWCLWWWRKRRRSEMIGVRRDQLKR